MSNRLSLFVLISLLVFFATGCGSDFNDPTLTSSNSNSNVATTDGDGSVDSGAGQDPVQPPANIDIRQVEVTIDPPSGAPLNLSDLTVMSQLAEYPVDDQGRSTVLLPEEGRVLAIVFDSSNNPVLLGMLTDDKRTINVATTAEVMVYLGLGTVYLSEEIKVEYFENVRTFDGFNQLVSDVTALLQADENYLTSQAFQTLLRDYVNDISRPGSLIDIAPRISYTADIRSGLQIDEEPGDVVKFVNTLRRRCHAFVYKVAVTNLSGQRAVLVDDVVKTNATAQSQRNVGATADITSVLGTAQNWASGKGLEVGRKESDPVSLALTQNEDEAEYKVRVIGPSARPDRLTALEEERLRRLEVETFALDVLLPVLFSAISDEKLAKNFQSVNAEGYVTAVSNLVKSLPKVNDAIAQGDFGSALREFLEASQDGFAADRFEAFWKNLIDGTAELKGGFSQANSQRLLNTTEKFFKYLKAIDIGLQVADVSRIAGAWLSTSMVEEWDIKVTKNKVLLEPERAIAVRFEEEMIEATVQDGELQPGDVYEYEWSTSGTYGVLRDPLGKEGVSFTSSQSKIAYYANASTIPDGAEDTVSVKVYRKSSQVRVLVGEAEGKVLVRPEGFRISPDDLEIKGGSQIVLRVLEADGSDPTANSDLEYQFVWNTAGSFGLFDGVTRNLTVGDENMAVYSALELEQTGTESVSVYVYSREAGGDSSFELVDTVEGTIKINNDPLKEIFYISHTFFEGTLPMGGYYHGVWFLFDPVPNAVSYNLLVVADNDAVAVPDFLGKTESWVAGNPDDLYEGQYRFIAADGSGAEEFRDASRAVVSAAAGTAKITVTLKPNSQ